jgi:hypothetical protein
MPGATEAFTAAGSTLYISAGLPASSPRVVYAALTYTEVGEVTDGGGGIGRTYNVVQHQPLSKRGVVKLKGSFDDGTQNPQMAYAPGDAGQTLLKTALDDDAFYSLYWELQDGTKIYFQSQVTALPTNIGTADTIVGSAPGLAVKSGTLVYVYPA